MSRIQFTFVYLPYSMALKGINYRRKKIFRHSDYMEDQEYDLGELKSKLDSGSRGSLSYSEDMAFHRLTEALSCSTYLFGVYGERFTLSSRFLANLDLLEKVRRETGARIFFAWPTVAAKDDVGCYDEITEKLAVHAAAVQGAVVAKGFEFLGRVGDSRFSAECILNSFYHVKQACAEVRTRRLIEQLEAAGISGESGMSTGEVNGVLLEEWRRLGEKLRTQE